MNWYMEVLRKYADFSGRARRKEYWMFFLMNILITIAVYIIEFLLHIGGIPGLVYSLALLIPGIAVAVRRLHDTGRSGWWLLLNLIPLIGWLVTLFFLVGDSVPGDNAYGPNPKAVTA